MIQYIYLYFLAVPIFFLIDMLWLGFVANKFYQSQLAHLLGPVNWTAAITFYLLYIVGIVVFAILPGIESSSLVRTLILGALFGFIAYATYDLTNLATLNDWPMAVVVVDMIWGAVLTASVAGITYYLARLWIF